MSDGPLLEASRLSKTYVDASGGVLARRRIEAVHDLSFRLARGGSLAIVGESGSGKTTTARMVVGLEMPTAGSISFSGLPLAVQPGTAERRRRARKIQIVFQNPHLSLDPKQSPVAALEEVLKLHLRFHGKAGRERALELLASVGLTEREALSLPKRLSGGQAQRVAIARALAAEPELLVLDEAVSSLDVSVQAQILNLLADIRNSLGVAYLFISHDLAVVRQISDDVLVMYRGRAVEYGRTDLVLTTPAHPYTKKLLDSVPRPGVVWTTATMFEDPESGCRFRNRCPYVFDRCRHEPPLFDLEDHIGVRCWLAERIPVMATCDETRVQ